ncbi:MAG: lysylphosphatidylglycerol synthase transmembrane domain-containing protein [bacterium]
MATETRQRRTLDPQHPLKGVSWNLLVSLVILGAVVAYYIKHYGVGTQVITTFLSVPPYLVVGMLLTQILYVVIQGGFFRSLYQALSQRRSLLFSSSLFLSMNLVNTVAPVVGLSGSYFMVSFERQRGMSRSVSVLINFLYYLIDYVVFLLVLVVGLWMLLLWGKITSTILITSLVFTVFVAAFVCAGLILLSHPTALRRLLGWISRVGGRFSYRKRPIYAGAKVSRFVESAQEGWKDVYRGWSRLIEASGLALALHLTSISLLMLAFYAAGYPAGLQVLVAGYTVGTLLNIVSITPGGIGFAEGGMTAVFVALKVPVEQALVIALMYRTVFVWFTLLLGIPALHYLPRLSKEVSLE